MNINCEFCVFIIFVIIFQYAGAQNECNKADEEKLTLEKILNKDILCNYKKQLRPVLKHSTPINITSEMLILNGFGTYQRMAIEGVHMKMALTLRWRDEFLVWDSNLYGGINEILMDSSKIWYPRFTVMNTERMTQSTFKEPCTIKSTGHVECTDEFSFRAICHKKYKHWPYDTHNCTIEFGMWLQKDEEVNIRFTDSKFSISPNFTSGNWIFSNTEVMSSEDVFAYTMYPCIMIKFTMQRNLMFIKILQILILPLLSTLVAALVATSMEIQSLGRVLASILNIHLHMEFQTTISDQMYADEEETAIAVIYAHQSFILACVIMIHLVAVRYFASKTSQPPPWITTIVGTMDSGVGKVIMFREFDTSFISTSFLEDFENLTGETKSTANEEWIRFAHILNRTFGICVYLSYFFMLLQFAY